MSYTDKNDATESPVGRNILLPPRKRGEKKLLFEHTKS